MQLILTWMILNFYSRILKTLIPRPWHYRSGTLLWGRCSLRPTAVCLAHLSRTLGRFPSKNPTHSSAFFQDFPAQTESINSVWFGRSYFMTFPWRISGIFSPSPLDHAHFEVTSPLELATCRASQGLLRQFLRQRLHRFPAPASGCKQGLGRKHPKTLMWCGKLV